MWIRESTKREPSAGEHGFLLRLLTRIRGVFSFVARGSSSTYGTWTANGGSSISTTTFNILTGTNNSARSVNHSIEIISERYDGLTVEFTSSCSGVDGIGIGLGDFSTTTTASIPVDTGGNIYIHCLWLEFGGGVVRLRTASNTTQRQVASTSSGTNTWKVVYKGLDRTNMTAEVYKSGSLLFSQTGVVLPASARLMMIGRAGGSAGTASFSNVTYTMLG